VLDSLSVNVLIHFTSERFGIAVPQDEVTAENLKDLDAHVVLLMRLA
jgi:acyl carrier protein